MGIILSVAGYMKLVGIAGTIDYFTKLGFPIPLVTAWFITLLEVSGGIALILGLFVRYLGLIYTTWPALRLSIFSALAAGPSIPFSWKKINR